MIWEALYHATALDYHSGRNKRGGGARMLCPTRNKVFLFETYRALINVFLIFNNFQQKEGGQNYSTPPPFILCSNPYCYIFHTASTVTKKIEITKMLFKITLSISHYIRNIKQTLRFISNYQALLRKLNVLRDSSSALQPLQLTDVGSWN